MATAAKKAVSGVPIKDLNIGDCIESLVSGGDPNYNNSDAAKPGDVGRISSLSKGSTHSQAFVWIDLAGGARFVRKYIQARQGSPSAPVARLLEGEELRSIKKALNDQAYKRGLERGFSKRPTSCSGSGATGTDPELFAFDKKGKVIPAFTWLPAKDERVVSEEGFWDGFQAEFNPHYATCHQGLEAGIWMCLRNLKRRLSLVDPTARLAPVSVVKVDKKILKDLPDQHVALGCSVSFNAYGEKPLEVLDPRSLTLRTAGCHIHLGIGRSADKIIDRVVKAIDAIAGVAMTSLFSGMEDPRRRKYYGRAGEYRLPLHGLEYRVPPAEVLCHPITYMLCFDLVRSAAAFALNDFSHYWEANEQ
jgi:hypothetical protein